MFQFFDYSKMFTPEEVLDYLRKSRSDDPTLTVEEVLEKHEIMLDEWSERNLGGKVPQKNKFREVVSGETIADRPEFQKVLKLIENPKYKAIKVVEVQRLSRGDLEDAGKLIKLLRYTNTYVITPQKTYDLRDEYDRQMFENELKRGNDYLEYTKKIMNNGRLLSVSQGNYIGNIAPYGYKKDWIVEGKKKCPTLSINEEQAEIVRLVFNLYVNQNMGRTNICHYLDSLGVPAPKGEKWSPYTIADMLENVHYLGKVRWNWRKTVLRVEDGEIIESRPRTEIGEYLVYEGKHKAIISEEIFNLAQAKKGKNHRAKPTTKVRNPLASLIYCKCGRAMSLRFYKNKDGSERNPPRLLCDNQTHCKTGSCLYSDMIDRVCEILKKCINDFEIRVNEDYENSEKLHLKLIKNLEKKKEDLRKKEVAQWEAQSNPDPTQRMPSDIFRELNEKLLKEKAEVEEALCKAYNSVPVPVDYAKKSTTFKAALKALQDDETSAEDKNKLLKECIERITYNRDKPERVKSNKKRVTINGRRIKADPITPEKRWTNPPIELDVKLK